MSELRVLAFYLPQFHPIPENDEWWGTGFTEWTNVVRARPLFREHDQPRLPADLGFYDLRVPEVREQQAGLARDHGIHGFCYYHYWFNGRRLLGRPFEEVLSSGRPDFPFALCWANEDWTRAWTGRGNEQLLRQEYSEDDDREHIRWLAGPFSDDRYIRVDGKPLFLVYRAGTLPDPAGTTARWREEARRLGIGELYLCRVESFAESGDPRRLGFDAAVEFQPDWPRLGPSLRRRRAWRALRGVGLSDLAYGRHRIYDYGDVVDRMLRKPTPDYLRFPGVTPSWDNSPRRSEDAVILREATPERYEGWLRSVVSSFDPPTPEENLVFINAWNEWAEGNVLEPTRRWGRRHLEATRRAIGASPPVGVAMSGKDRRAS
jgi:lipopolysaccharide biosynthesis protein